MKPGDVLFTGGTLAVGVWAGEALGGLSGAIIGGLFGALMGIAVFLFAIRIMVAVPVFIGMVAGGVLGRSIVHALCLPESCKGTEIAAALLTGIGTLVGVGLVVALVTRSFDEYRESRGLDSDSRHQTPDTRGGDG